MDDNSRLPYQQAIVLSLTNIDELNASTAPLFSLPPNGGSALQTYWSFDDIDETELTTGGTPTTWTITGTGGPYLILSEPTTIAALLAEMTSKTGDTWTQTGEGELIFSVSAHSTKTYTGLIRQRLPATTLYTPTSASTLYDNSVQIEIEAGGLSYDAILNELVFQPYLLPYANVYANNIA